MKKLTAFFLVIFMMQSVSADMTCDTAMSDYYAVYEVNSYTCSVGYFLPAGMEGCEPCPSGATCEGGTFDFDPDNFQGLVFNSVSDSTMNNSCASNFPIDLYAVYEPNTITVRWDDGNGGAYTTTCTYGGTLTTPTTPPVAPKGYHFTGWSFDLGN